METWALNPSSVAALGAVIGSLAVPIAVAALVIQNRQNQKARNLEAILTISADFRARWEKEWGSLVMDRLPRLSLAARHRGEVGRQLSYILNWLDWMGVLIRMRWIDKEVLFASLAAPIRDILRESAHKLQADTDARGKAFWANVLLLAEQPEINVNIAEEAQRLRQRWLPSPRPIHPSHPRKVPEPTKPLRSLPPSGCPQPYNTSA